MLTYAEAHNKLASLTCQSATETLPLHQAAGRVVAQAISLAGDQPAFNRATMDGYAICLKENCTTYTVRGTVFAGSTYTDVLNPGEAVRIMTGAPAPQGTTVIPHELTDRGETQVTITDTKGLQANKNIAWQGEDGRAGAIIIEAGTRLSPLVLSLAAMAGIKEISVSKLPSLGVVTTGDEVGGSGPAGIHDSNGPFLHGLAAYYGLPISKTHADDQENELRSSLEHASDKNNIVITTGGVSAGAKDLVPNIAKELGFTTVFHHVAMQPGKPILVMQRENTFLIGLPGNPVSVVATAHLFLIPLIHQFMRAARPAWLSLPLTAPTANKSPRQQFMPARFTAGGVERTPWNGSGDLIAAACSDGLINLPIGCELNRGDHVEFMPFIGWQPGMVGTMPTRNK